MKVIVFCDYFREARDNTASYRVRWLNAREMARKGHEVVFIYPVKSVHFERSTPEPGLTAIGVPGVVPMIVRRSGFSVLDTVVRTVFTILNLPDAMYVTNGHRPVNLIPCLIARLLRNTVIADETWEWMGEGGYADRRKGIAGRMLAAYDKAFEIPFKDLFDVLIVITSELRKRFRKQEKVHVLHGGAESGNLVPYTRSEARSMLGISQGAFIIGMSSLVRGDHRDNEAFLRALSLLCREHGDVFLLATSSDASYINEIKSTCHLQDRIIYPGYLEYQEYNRHLSSCDIFVLPYPDTQINRGRWPNKLGDYISLGRPVITNPTGDVKDLFMKYRLGFLCEASPDGYYNTLVKVIAGNDMLTTAAEDAEHVAGQVLDLGKRVDSVITLFRSALQKRSSVS